LANVHYLRYGSHFVLLATKGHHPFFAEEAKRIRDARQCPILIEDYSLSVRRGHFLKKHDECGQAVADGKYRVRVQIFRERLRLLKAHFLELALHRRAEALVQAFWRLPFEPYAPVRRQLLNLLRLVNQLRREAGYERIPTDTLRYRRRIVKPFERLDALARNVGANDRLTA